MYASSLIELARTTVSDLGIALPQPGDLERIRRDKRVHVEERDACLKAFSDFQDKFSAMLAVFCPVVMP